MNRIIRAYLVIPVMLLLTSCCGQKVVRDLSDIESYIDDRPDSALVAIRQIDSTALRTKAQKAKFALLHAMALDKNYIDTADTRIIQPAVDYYDRHGCPEDRLKANYYLGRALYNDKQYNKAIIAYSSAEEQMVFSQDSKYCGMLCVGLADTYSKTFDYVQAQEYIEKAILYFSKYGKSDYIKMAEMRRAGNYARLENWNDARDCYEALLSDATLSNDLRYLVEADYASFLVFSPISGDSLALELFANVLKAKGKLNNYDQYGAYAYSLYAAGFQEQSDAIIHHLSSASGADKYYYHYYNHLIEKHKGQYRQAYNSLYEAKNIADSVAEVAKIQSASKALDNYLRQMEIEKRLRLKNRYQFVLNILLIFIIISCALAFYSWNKNRINLQEQGRMSFTIESLKKQVRDLSTDTKDKDEQINKLLRLNTKARFQYLASLYEVIYPFRNEEDRDSDGVLYRKIERLVSNLRNDKIAQKKFEDALNNESGGIMRRFRIDYPDLSDKEYLLASYIFAGFDNTTIMLIMGNSTLEYTRVKKNRLKTKISKSTVKEKDIYISYF